MGIRLTAHSHSSNLKAVYELCYMEFLWNFDIKKFYVELVAKKRQNSSV